MPRNVHRSVMGAMVLCGAVPVYVDPACDERLGIPLGMRREDVELAIKKHPNAKAVLVNNPTYYGICSDLKAIAKMAHDHGMLCLADEAHGTHFYFSDQLPMSAMEAGADMAAVSMHKSGGSLTQSSLLLTGPAMQEGHVRQIINLTQTTSGSYLLLSSLDISRRNLALRGKAGMDTLAALSCIFTLADGIQLALNPPSRTACPTLLWRWPACFFCFTAPTIKKCGLRLSCRTAAASAYPLPGYSGRGKMERPRHLCQVVGYGRGLRQPDSDRRLGAQRVFRRVCPLLLLGCVLLFPAHLCGHPKSPSSWCGVCPPPSRSAPPSAAR